MEEDAGEFVVIEKSNHIMTRKLIIGLGVLLLTISAKGQSISDIFTMLPDTVVDNLTIKEREKIITNKSFYPTNNTDEEKVVYTLEENDTTKNFLRVEMTFESGQTGFESFELRSFEMPNGGKIVIYSNIGGAPNNYAQNKLIFFECKNGKLYYSKTNYLPKEIGLKDFIKPATPKSLKKKYEEYSCSTYDLGYQQRNITYDLNDNYLYNNGFNSNYIIGNSIEFIWNGYGFERQKVTKKK